MEENRPVTNIQFSGDDRLISTVFPIEEQLFGHRGALCMIQEAPKVFDNDHTTIDLIVESPVFLRLAPLSTSELRILYHLAKGKTTQQIASDLFRSNKTVENQISNMHKKLGTSSRGQLVQFASGRGIEKYTPDQWETIITSVRTDFDATGGANKAAKPNTDDSEPTGD